MRLLSSNFKFVRRNLRHDETSWKSSFWVFHFNLHPSIWGYNFVTKFNLARREANIKDERGFVNNLALNKSSIKFITNKVTINVQVFCSLKKNRICNDVWGKFVVTS